MGRQEIYKGIKLIGFVSFIPFMLAFCPLAGFFLGDFLKRKFDLPSYIVIIAIAFGFLAGIMETLKIIKLLVRINKK